MEYIPPLPHKKFARHVQRLLRRREEWPSGFEATWKDLNYESTFSHPDMRAWVDYLILKLANGNPSPLRQQLEILPYVLADPIVMSVLSHLWSWKSLDTPAGAAARRTIAALFDGLGNSLGRPENPEAVNREKNRKRQADLREKGAKATAALLKEMTKEVKRLAPSRDWKTQRQKEVQIRDAILTKAEESKDAHKQNAAKKLKKHIVRERAKI